MSRIASCSFLAVIAVALWALYSLAPMQDTLSSGQMQIRMAPPDQFSTPSALAVIGIPSKMTDTIVIAGINLNQPIGADISSLTNYQIRSLQDGYASNPAGSTPYRQTFRISSTTPPSFSGGYVTYGQDQAGNTGDFLVFRYGQPAFEYELLFDNGISSHIAGSNLPDLEETSFTFMGTPCTIYKASRSGNSVSIRFFAKGGDVEIYDADITDNTFEKNVKINGQTVNSESKIIGTVSNNEVRIISITYRFLAYAKLGADAYLMPKRGIRQYLRESNALINPSFDIIYGGIKGQNPSVTQTQTSSQATTQSSYSSSYGGNVFFDPVGGDRYNLIFTNLAGRTLKVPYLSLNGGTVSLGNGKQSLVVREGNSISDFNIDEGDMFLTTSSNDPNGLSDVVIYSSLSPESNTIYFDVLGGGSQQVVYDPTTGHGVLNVGGYSHEVYADLSGTNRIVVDQNHDGQFTGARSNFVTNTGAQIEPGSNTIVRIARRLFNNAPSNDETVTINFFDNGNKIDLRVPTQTDLTMHSSSDRLERGMTTYGVQYTLDNRQPPSTLSLDVPGGQRASRVAAVSRPSTALSQSTIGKTSKAGQSGAYVVITFEREKFLPKATISTGRVTPSGVGIND